MLSPNQLNKVMYELRKKAYSEKCPDLNKCDWYFEECCKNGEPYLLPLIALRSKPCTWSQIGGCTMCGYNLVSSKASVPTKENFINQTKYALDHIKPEKYPIICLNTAGSMMNHDEIDSDTRNTLLDLINKEGFEEWYFECRANYLLNEDELQSLHDHFKGYISVGIGLETSNEFIRANCVNKGITNEIYLRANKVLNKTNIEYDAYIFNGKPFLTEKENIQDCVDTIKFALDNKATYCHLMIANFHPSTLTYWLHQHGKYDLPNLWSAVEILEKLSKNERERVTIHGFKTRPTPLKIASTGDNADIDLIFAITQFNLTRDYEMIRQILGIHQDKYQNWKNRLTDSEKTLEQRVEEGHDFIAKEFGL